MALSVPGIDYDATASNLSSARNALIYYMGQYMVQAKEAGAAEQPMLVAVAARKFAEAATALLMLKFLPDFQYLEDITLGGRFEEPIPLADRIHVHLQGTTVPPSILNALEDMRVIGNKAVFVYADAQHVGKDDVDKIYLLLMFVAKFVIRGGQVGNKVALSARRDGQRGPPPGAQGSYFADTQHGRDAHPLSVGELHEEVAAMDAEDAQRQKQAKGKKGKQDKHRGAADTHTRAHEEDGHHVNKWDESPDPRAQSPKGNASTHRVVVSMQHAHVAPHASSSPAAQKNTQQQQRKAKSKQTSSHKVSPSKNTNSKTGHSPSKAGHSPSKSVPSPKGAVPQKTTLPGVLKAGRSKTLLTIGDQGQHVKTSYSPMAGLAAAPLPASKQKPDLERSRTQTLVS